MLVHFLKATDGTSLRSGFKFTVGGSDEIESICEKDKKLYLVYSESSLSHIAIFNLHLGAFEQYVKTVNNIKMKGLAVSSKNQAVMFATKSSSTLYNCKNMLIFVTYQFG